MCWRSTLASSVRPEAKALLQRSPVQYSQCQGGSHVSSDLTVSVFILLLLLPGERERERKADIIGDDNVIASCRLFSLSLWTLLSRCWMSQEGERREAATHTHTLAHSRGLDWLLLPLSLFPSERKARAPTPLWSCFVVYYKGWKKKTEVRCVGKHY